jgi:hypothetical protein
MIQNPHFLTAISMARWLESTKPWHISTLSFNPQISDAEPAHSPGHIPSCPSTLVSSTLVAPCLPVADSTKTHSGCFQFSSRKRLRGAHESDNVAAMPKSVVFWSSAPRPCNPSLSCGPPRRLHHSAKPQGLTTRGRTRPAVADAVTQRHEWRPRQGRF